MLTVKLGSQLYAAYNMPNIFLMLGTSKLEADVLDGQKYYEMIFIC